jgi:hypothetical protein
MLLLTFIVPYLATEMWVRSVRFRVLADYYDQKVMQIGTITRLPINHPQEGKSRLAVVQDGLILPEGPEADELERQYYSCRQKAEEFKFASQHPWYPVWLPSTSERSN